MIWCSVLFTILLLLAPLSLFLFHPTLGIFDYEASCSTPILFLEGTWRGIGLVVYALMTFAFFLIHRWGLALASITLGTVFVLFSI